MASDSPAKTRTTSKTVVRVIIVSLLIDLLAFTLPLPLFPRIIQSYITHSNRNPDGSNSLLASLLHFLSWSRERLQDRRSSLTTRPGSGSSASKQDIVLLGGLLGSLFSLCQFIVSPYIGALSDAHGRRRILLLSMLGNILSAALWLVATNFELYLLSRIVGGLSEGNVQLAIACISDCVPPEKRARSLALVGMCFAIAFSCGPPLGAYLATNLESWTTWHPAGVSLTAFALPAVVSLALLVAETAYLYAFLPETKGWAQHHPHEKTANGNGKEQTRTTRPIAERRERLAKLERLLLLFSFVFSGAEFTLTFLTFDLFSYSNVQNGRLLGVIGILSSLAQGGVVRRRAGKIGSGPLARSGLLSCFLALFFLASLPVAARTSSTSAALPPSYSLNRLAALVLWATAACFAWSSASVVNSLNALASLECDEESETPASSGAPQNQLREEGETLPKGRTLGRFRSAGQLGRALGPLSITAAYWLAGPSVTYAAAGVAMTATWYASRRTLKKEKVVEKMQ